MANPAAELIKRRLPYLEGVNLQKEIWARMADDKSLPGTVVFAEHNPVITCGRSGDGTNLLASPDELHAAGIEFYPSSRGGDVTYHGPGQWTVYPVLRLEWYDKNLHAYLRLLEECVIRFLSYYDIKAARRPGLTGAWVEAGKVAAVGVAVNRWITWHGFALNINPNLANFTRFMHPCGIRAEQGGVASLTSITGVEYILDDVLPNLRQAVEEVLQLELR